jgi:hypothetical protein
MAKVTRDAQTTQSLTRSSERIAQDEINQIEKYIEVQAETGWYEYTTYSFPVKVASEIMRAFLDAGYAVETNGGDDSYRLKISWDKVTKS